MLLNHNFYIKYVIEKGAELIHHSHLIHPATAALLKWSEVYYPITKIWFQINCWYNELFFILWPTNCSIGTKH